MRNQPSRQIDRLQDDVENEVGDGGVEKEIGEKSAEEVE
jgi:hypothetical protein